MQTEDTDEEIWLKTAGANGEELCYKLGQGELSVAEISDYIVGSASRNDQMHIVTDLDTADVSLYANKEVAVASVVRELNLPSGSTAFTPPVFFVFADKKIPSDSLSALRAIRFSEQGRTRDENH